MSLITYLTRIHFADRVLEDALPVEMRRLAIRRPLILVDDAGEEPELCERVEDALPERATGPIVTTTPETSVADLQKLLKSDARDAVIALGGPGVIDLARLLSPAMRQGRSAPVIAIPTTTAGVGLGPVPGADRPAPRPDVILCDPTLTLWADPARTAAAGIDALSHCVEAYLGTAFNPPADGIALEGVRRASRWLERAVADGRDLAARREVLAAALNAGLASEKGMGGADAATRAVEAVSAHPLWHGTGLAAILPRILEFNAPAIADRFEALADALGLAREADLLDHLGGLGERIGLPRRLSALGLGREALGAAARRAAEDPASRTNPRHATEADYLGLLEAAF